MLLTSQALDSCKMCNICHFCPNLLVNKSFMAIVHLTRKISSFFSPKSGKNISSSKLAYVFYFVIQIILQSHNVTGQTGLIRYYGLHFDPPTGETIIRTTFVYYGPAEPGAKWVVECKDGEGLIGLRDTADDFEELLDVKCRFLFNQKPPTRGMYPFYENCFVRNITLGEFHCFDPLVSNNSANSFATAFWDDDPIFRVGLVLPFKTYFGTKMKCCSMPVGYYIDYSTCHYRYTHDQFYTFYDISFYVVQCPDTYAMTGIGTLKTPHDEDVHYDWIQCCRYYFQPPAGVDFAVLPDYYPEYKKLQYDTHHSDSSKKLSARKTLKP